MALVHDKFFLDITLVDASGENKSTVRLDLNYADWAALNTAIGAGAVTQIMTDLDAVTNAVMLSYRVGEAFIEDTNKNAPAGVEVENYAAITCDIDGELNKTVTLKLPAPSDGVFQATTGKKRNVVDTTYVALQTWLAHFGPAGECLVSDGESIADPTGSPAPFSGRRMHRGSRKG